jgi:MFS family permease
MGGALMTPIARLVLVRATPRNELVGAMAWLTIPGLVGPIVGPPFGGFLTTYFSWHWIFIINVPIGILGIWLVGKYLPEFSRNAPRRIDFPGFFLAGTCFAGFVFGLSVITLPALPPIYGIVTIAIGFVAGALYVWHAARTEYPILDLRLLRFPLFRSTVVAGTFFRLGLGAIPLLLPLMLQLVFGLSPFESGLVTFASAIGALSAKFVAEWIIEAFGFKGVLVASTAVSSVGILVMGFYTPATPHALIVTILILAGFAQSTFWTTQAVFTFADIEDRDAAQANVISQVWGQMTFALGVALGGGALEVSHLLHGGGELLLSDFHTAFFVVGAVTALSTMLFLRLPRGAGSHISGHGIAREAAE